MYDWNGNGKHDVFDDAIFHALLDDDLRRYPPEDEPYRARRDFASKPSDSEPGCLAIMAILVLVSAALVCFAEIGIL